MGGQMARGKNRKGLSSKSANLKASEKFLKQNAQKATIFTTPSNLQYEIVEENSGPKPKRDSIVTVHQRIKLIDGTVIADTYKSNTPESFPIKEAIDGYFEGLSIMSVGARFRFFIPPELAWGTRGAGSKIGPNVAIIIDCRLLHIE